MFCLGTVGSVKVEWYFGPDGGSARKASESGNLHSFQFPGLRMDEVQARAEQLYHEIIAHERVISYEAPGIIALEPRQFMSLTGKFHMGWNACRGCSDNIVR